ncbi:MAG: M1 family metallopeptidase [Flavobacteriia bacterium]|nr:M1 family metallopeptidase [Flavobacteriia bacterium]
MKRLSAIVTAFGISLGAFAQANYWQNHVEYRMDIKMNVEDHTFAGEQWLTFTNNSPDTLTEAFYHLYFNAFQPESMMDVRSRNISDPDRRVQDRISKLNGNEVGYHEVYLLEQDGMTVEFSVTQTIMKVKLARPIAPGDASVFHMKFNSQVPVQIRRSGRDNAEGVAYSMSQWYPKMAMYDEDGWHPDPYVGREFYGEFGNFVVNIEIDKDYVVGGTGVLTNPTEVGHGYADVPEKRTNTITYKFTAENVHDFAWAADPDFVHDVVESNTGMPIHFFYKEETANVENWKKLEEMAPAYFEFMGEHFGEYQYPQFSVIQAGDGGMEYPMCTFVVGGGDEFEGFLGLFVHEATHNWYYGMLGTDEQRYPWMDEGFTTFAEDECMKALLNREEDPHAGTYSVYARYQLSDRREPMSTPADHFNHNFAYSVSSYYLGSIFLNQLRTVVGEEAFWNGMMTYFDTWKFKHPKPEDFIRIMERESGIVLDWYLYYWVDQTKSIDYGIAKVEPMGQGSTHIQLERLGEMPMPVDVAILFNDGNVVFYTIPLVMMQNHKKDDRYLPEQAWPWTHPTYDLQVNFNINDIKAIAINPSRRVADVNIENEMWTPDSESNESNEQQRGESIKN